MGFVDLIGMAQYRDKWRAQPLGRPRRRWVNNIKMYLIEIEWGLWTGLVWLSIRTSGELL
jgi:hypothetical protein